MVKSNLTIKEKILWLLSNKEKKFFCYLLVFKRRWRKKTEMGYIGNPKRSKATKGVY